MHFVTNALFVLSFVFIIVRDVSSEDNPKPEIKSEDARQQEQNFDYWEIDHNEASAIYYEPADLFTEKPFELSKNFFISNPRTEGSLYSLDKTYSSTTKEKRNLLNQNTDTTELCVNDSAIDEGTNVFLDVNLASSPTLRNSDNEELTAELLSIEDIQSTEKKLAECIDLHLFKNRDVIENWQLLLSEGKIQMYSILNQTDIDKKIHKECKHLEDIIENNLDLLKRSTPKRNKDITTVSTTENVFVSEADKLLTQEENTTDSDSSPSNQTDNSLRDLSTDSSILTSQYQHGTFSNIPKNNSVLNEKPVTEINNIKTVTGKPESSDFLSKNPSNASVNKSQNNNENYRRSNTLDSKPKRNQGHEMAYKESEIKIPKIITKELLNGSIISDANGTEALPNNDFKDFETDKKETISNHKENATSTINFNIYETKKENLYEETTPAARDNNKSATHLGTEPTPQVNYSDPFSYTAASTEKDIAQQFDLANKNNMTNSFINISKQYMEKWSGENSSVDEKNTASTSTTLKHETTTNKNNIHGVSQVDSPQYTTKGASSSSLNGTLFFDFNGNLVPTHFVQNAEGSINIAIDGKSFCDNVLNKLKSVLLQTICKYYYDEAKINDP